MMTRALSTGAGETFVTRGSKSWYGMSIKVSRRAFISLLVTQGYIRFRAKWKLFLFSVMIFCAIEYTLLPN